MDQSSSTPAPLATGNKKDKVSTMRKLVGMFRGKSNATLSDHHRANSDATNNEPQPLSWSAGSRGSEHVGPSSPPPPNLARQHSLVGQQTSSTATASPKAHSVSDSAPGFERRRSRSFLGAQPEDASKSTGNMNSVINHNGNNSNTNSLRGADTSSLSYSTGQHGSNNDNNNTNHAYLSPLMEPPLAPEHAQLLLLPSYWKLGQKLGEGTFGAVWEGLFKPANRTFAVKKIKHTPETEEPVMKELQLMRQLEHPHVVRTFGGGLSNHYFWIVMEFMHLGPLTAMMKALGKPLDELSAAVVVKDVCSGLSYLHEKGILHKDIKSANILVNERAVCKLGDLGVSQRRDAEGSRVNTPTGTLVMRNLGGGTLAFMAPEVLKGTVCAKSDVWSLGITLIEILKGSVPRENMPELQLTESIMDPQQAPRLEGGRFSESSIDFVARCVQPDLQERASLQELCRHPFIASSFSRERALLTQVQKALKIKEELREEEESQRRRALVTAQGKKPAPAPTQAK